MPIDFAGLVLGPCMTTFAESITVDPRTSQPGVAPYAARGVYNERPIDVELADNAILSSADKTLGIRLADFSEAPQQGDIISVRGATYLVEDADDDGQGGSVLALREIRS